jgi:hypothetical protein
MAPERRYGSDEIDEILGRALDEREHRDREGPVGDGLTLAELKDVGREVGIPPERIESAALSLDRAARVERTLGLPLRVERTAPLPRELTEPEWEELVTDLRATFGATGKIHRDGRLRGWTNGNLHVFVEPEGSGYRLRMGTTKGNARSLFAVGAGMLGMSGVVATVGVVTGDPTLGGAGALLAMGVATSLAAGLPLPSWARTRARQMEDVAHRTAARLQRGSSGD